MSYEEIYTENFPSFKLTPRLESEGWLSFRDNICIPLPDFCGEYKYLMIKRREFPKKNAYHYFFVKEPNGQKQKYKHFLRGIPPASELGQMEWLLDGSGDPSMGQGFCGALTMNFDAKRFKDDSWKEYSENIIKLMREENCLEIFKNKYYQVPKKEQCSTMRNPPNEEYLQSLFSERKNIGQARQGLAGFIKSKYGLFLRKNSHELYILDGETNFYSQVNFDELFSLVSWDLGEGLINEDDLNEAIKYISDRRDPQHNIVRFKNCLFDMDKLEIIDTEKPTFTIVSSPYNYNPKAESTILSNFLNTSLEKKNPIETDEAVKCIKQLTGYLFTSGNTLNVLPMIIGISGGGKSVFANILTAIFGKDKVADLKLQEIETNSHATSSLINKHLNIIQDSDASRINNNSLIKQITGNDPLQVNPKYLQPFVLPPEEVPKSILIGNHIPLFTRLEQALIERFLIIEFNVKFRGEDDEDPELLKKILANHEEIEWFIYESLNEYKIMIDNGEDFLLRKKGDATRDLVNKHQKPLNYLFREIINGFSYNDWANSKEEDSKDKSKEEDSKDKSKEEDSTDRTVDNKSEEHYVSTKALREEIIHLAKTKGIDLDLNSKGDISAKQMIKVIRNEFDLYESSKKYESKTHNGERYYPHLIPKEKYKVVLSIKDDLDQNDADSS